MTSTAPTYDLLTKNLSAKRKLEQEFLGEFVANHGTENQRERFAAGVMPGAELVGAMRDVAFAAAAGMAPFRRITVEEVKETGETVSKSEFRSIAACELTAAQWDKLKGLRELLPEATITAKLHEARGGRRRWGVVTRLGALAVIQFGPFELRKEFEL